MDKNTKELRVIVNQGKYDCLKAVAEESGYRSVSSHVRDLVDRQVFEALYLKGTFGKQNTKQIRKLLKAIKNRQS